MSLKAYEENDIRNIANSIRNKGQSGTFTVNQMASAIDNIQTGGSYGTLNVLSNGVYSNPSPYDAWNQVNVQVPTSVPSGYVVRFSEYEVTSGSYKPRVFDIVSFSNSVSGMGRGQFVLNFNTRAQTIQSIIGDSVEDMSYFLNPIDIGGVLASYSGQLLGYVFPYISLNVKNVANAYPGFYIMAGSGNFIPQLPNKVENAAYCFFRGDAGYAADITIPNSLKNGYNCYYGYNKINSVAFDDISGNNFSEYMYSGMLRETKGLKDVYNVPTNGVNIHLMLSPQLQESNRVNVYGNFGYFKNSSVMMFDTHNHVNIYGIKNKMIFDNCVGSYSGNVGSFPCPFSTYVAGNHYVDKETGILLSKNGCVQFRHLDGTPIMIDENGRKGVFRLNDLVVPQYQRASNISGVPIMYTSYLGTSSPTTNMFGLDYQSLNIPNAEGSYVSTDYDVTFEIMTYNVLSFIERRNLNKSISSGGTTQESHVETFTLNVNWYNQTIYQFNFTSSSRYYHTARNINYYVGNSDFNKDELQDIINNLPY